MPKVNPLTQHDRELERIRGELRVAMADADCNQKKIATNLNLTQAAVSYMLKRPKTMKLDYFLYIMEMTGRKIVIQKRGDQGDD